MNRFASWTVGWVAVAGLSLLAACEKKPATAAPAVEAPAGAEEVKAVVGKEGGSLKFADTGARLEIPANLLQEEVTITLRREKPTFDLAGKDFLGMAYRIGPKLTFAPGAARLVVPVDKELPGVPADIQLVMYYYERLDSNGPEGPGFVQQWQPCAQAKFTGYSPDQKFLVFDIFETISDRTTQAPFGLFQVGYNLPPKP
jgi:hypothetical protein